MSHDSYAHYERLVSIAMLIERSPCKWSTEDDVQRHLAELTGFDREVSFGRSRLDLFSRDDGTVIEVKVRHASISAVLKQLISYASIKEVTGIILATTFSVKTLDVVLGKPVVIANLRQWGFLM